MTGNMIGYIIFLLLALFFIAIGISCFFAKKVTGFWANAKPIEVNDVSGYNRAMGKLWIAFGIGLALLGLPLLDGQNSPWILLSILGIFAEAILMMVIYTQVIEKKYRRK